MVIRKYFIISFWLMVLFSNIPPFVCGETFIYMGMTSDTAPCTLLGRYEVSVSTLTSVTGPFGPFDFLAMKPDGTLYATDDEKFYTVNLTSGATTLVGTLHEGPVVIECAGFTFQPDGTMLVHEYSNRTGSWLHKLYSGNPATGELTFLTNITGLSTGLYGIEYANGVLYGAYDNALYSINPATGVTTLIGTGTSAWDMAFSEDGLFGTAPDGGLYQINTADGSSTLVRNFRTTDNKDPWGLAPDAYYVGYTIAGQVTLEYWSDPTQVEVTVAFRQNGQTVRTETLDLDSQGNYTIANVPPGNYSLLFSASRFLKKAIAVQVVDQNLSDRNATLPNGDYDSDNEVTVFDINMVLLAFGGIEGEPGWDPAADMDGDGEITVFDINIVLLNFGMIGDE